jgi:hypothetical protein
MGASAFAATGHLGDGTPLPGMPLAPHARDGRATGRAPPPSGGGRGRPAAYDSQLSYGHSQPGGYDSQASCNDGFASQALPALSLGGGGGGGGTLPPFGYDSQGTAAYPGFDTAGGGGYATQPGFDTAGGGYASQPGYGAAGYAGGGYGYASQHAAGGYTGGGSRYPTGGGPGLGALSQESAGESVTSASSLDFSSGASQEGGDAFGYRYTDPSMGYAQGGGGGYASQAGYASQGGYASQAAPPTPPGGRNS